MAKAVFIQNPESIYDDRPGEAYNFPKMYLGTVRAAVGDWVVFYESRQGAFGYTGIQKVERIIQDPRRSDWFFAMLDQASQWSFETIVPRTDAEGCLYETMLANSDGSPIRGGPNTLAVRRLPEADFARIVQTGLREVTGPEALPRHGDIIDTARPEFDDGQVPYDPAPLRRIRESVLTSRALRDASFARQVKRAYGGRCAISGLALTNGGGRQEVEAAHIRPVKHGGPDIIQNGIALSGTIHWMFDRGLISVAEDYAILISHNKVPRDVANRLIAPEQKLRLPANPRCHPHPDYLRYHREEIFGRA